MKKLLTILCLLSTHAMANIKYTNFDKIIECFYPKECIEILGNEYSTAGNKSVIQYVEISCSTNNGYTSFFSGWTSTSSWLGAGRRYLPKKTIFKKWDKDYLDCNIKK